MFSSPHTAWALLCSITPVHLLRGHINIGLLWTFNTGLLWTFNTSLLGHIWYLYAFYHWTLRIQYSNATVILLDYYSQPGRDI